MPSPPFHPTAACTVCGYDLAGLTLPGKCPECGVRNTGVSPYVGRSPSIPPRWFCILRTAWFAAAIGTPAVAIILPLVREQVWNSMLQEEAGRVFVLNGFAGIGLIAAAALLRRWKTLIAVFVIIFVGGILISVLGVT